MCGRLVSTRPHSPSLGVSSSPRARATARADAPKNARAMSIRGVPQLRALRLVYCDVTGSSRGAKDFITSGGWGEFVARVGTTASTSTTSEVQRGCDPHVRASYANGNEKTVGLKNLSADAVATHCAWLASEKGKPGSKPMKGRHFTKRPSVQGRWTPFTFGGGAPYIDAETLS